MTGTRFAFLSAILLLNGMAARGQTISDTALAQLFDGARAHGLPIAPPELRGVPVLAPVPLPKPKPRKLIIPLPKSVPAYERTFRILSAHPEMTDRYDDLIVKYARQYGLEARLLKSIIAAESEFHCRALSPSRAMGLMQLLPATAEEMGVPREYLYDPEYNIRAGASYVAHLFERAWRRFKLKGAFTQAPMWVMQRVIAAYHAGPRFLHSTWWYAKTRSYLRKVLLYYRSKVTKIGRALSPRRWPPNYLLVSLDFLSLG